MMKTVLWRSLLVLLLPCTVTVAMSQGITQGVKKVKDITIYKDSMFYAAFPSIVKCQDGNFLLVFRRAPDRKVFHEDYTNHVDPNSYIVSMVSPDGEYWPAEPDLLYAHPFGGLQDPCLLRLKDGTLLCTSYAWAFIKPEGMQRLKQPYSVAAGATFLGGLLLKSFDGKQWLVKDVPHIEPDELLDALGRPIAACNRGALCEGKNGRLYWAVIANSADKPANTSLHLLASDDKGETWEYESVIAQDPEKKISFTETSLIETVGGDIVAFIRTENNDGQACIARSTDGGKTFGPWQGMGFRGAPLTAMRLPDGRVLLVYGYRFSPFGIRARILNAECTDYATASEIVLRDDGDSWDLGYPWPVMLDEHRALVVYYFNKGDGIRSIEGTILEIGVP